MRINEHARNINCATVFVLSTKKFTRAELQRVDRLRRMPRIVRRSSVSYRSLVLDALLELSESLSLVDWDALSKRWIVPAGLLLNCVYWLVSMQVSYLKKSTNNAVFDSASANRVHKNRGSGGNWWYNALWTTSFLFITCSLINTWVCFSRRREYFLTQREASRPSSSASNGTQSDPTTPLRNPVGTSGSLGWDLLGQFSPSLHPRKQAAARPSTPERIIAWDPSMSSLRLFAVYSPVHALIPCIFNRQPLALLVTLLLSLQTLYLVDLYDLHVSHKRLIYGQVFSDYEKNFVQPRIGVMKRDVGVGTRADDNGVYVEVHTPKFGIVDASKSMTGVPRSASQIKMHDWERPLGTSPNVWASTQSPVKANGPTVRQSQQQYQSSRLSVASPMKINGSPAKMYKPAGWGTGPQYGSSGNLFQSNDAQGQQHGGMRRSKTTSTLANPWE